MRCARQATAPRPCARVLLARVSTRTRDPAPRLGPRVGTSRGRDHRSLRPFDTEFPRRRPPTSRRVPPRLSAAVTDAAAIVANLRRAIAVLAELEDPAATLTAEVLTRWLAGEGTMEAAAGLPTDWRRRLEIAARDRALNALAETRADVDPTILANWIAGELRRGVGNTRRDGALGYIDDLARLNCGGLGARNLRRLIADIRLVANEARAMATGSWHRPRRRRD